MANLSNPGPKELKRLVGKVLSFTDETRLSSFMTSRSRHLLDSRRGSNKGTVPTCELPPGRGHPDQGYGAPGRQRQRGITLMKRFSGSVKDEEQKQYLL